MNQVMKTCDNICFLYEGRLERNGNKSEVLERDNDNL